MIRLLLFAALLLILAVPAAAQENVLSIGVAEGFPPYQFTTGGQPTGFDVDVAKAVAARLGMEARFVQGDWDSVVGMLRVGSIDMIAGMEVNEFRQAYFDFTRPYAKRHDVVFVLEDSSASKVEDLFGQVVTGDRHSYVELLWSKEGVHSHIRISQTKTKEDAMRLLAGGKTAAAIMPLEVGRYLARESGARVRVLTNPDPGSEVAMAVRKGRQGLRDDLDAALLALRRSGELDALAGAWFRNAPKPGPGAHP